jgi:uncharacterized DUF497 family protein
MEVLFRFHGQHFVWNADKAATNLAKHGISFELRARSSSTLCFVSKAQAATANSAMRRSD